MIPQGGERLGHIDPFVGDGDEHVAAARADQQRTAIRPFRSKYLQGGDLDAA